MEQFEILREAVAQVEQQLELDKITVERAVFGLFFSGVKLSTGHGGLCFTPVKEMPEAVCCPSSARAMPLSGRLRGRPVREYLDDIFGENILRRTLGIAALNALSVAAWEQSPPQDYEILMGVDAFDELDAARYPKTVVVGALVPMLKKLMAAGADFHVLEQDPAPSRSGRCLTICRRSGLRSASPRPICWSSPGPPPACCRRLSSPVGSPCWAASR